MKNKKMLKKIAIILSIIIVIIDIVLYIKMSTTWSEIGINHHEYENASLILSNLFRYGALLWGILLIPIVWIEYFLIMLLSKIFNKFEKVLRWLLCLIVLSVIVTILIFCVRMISLIFVALM